MKPSKRKVVHRSPAHTVRLLSLPHLQPEPVEADSSLERDFVHLAALFPQIRSIQHQPFTVGVASGSYTPDFLLVFVDESRAVVEVKPRVFLQEHADRLAAAEQVLREHGLHFLIALDDQIQKDGRAERALRIRRYCKSRPSEEQMHLAPAILQEHGPKPLRELMASGVQAATVAYLITRRILMVDPDLCLDPETLVHLSKTDNQGEKDAVRFSRWLANTTR